MSEGFPAVVYFRMGRALEQAHNMHDVCNMHERKINGHAKETGHSDRLPVTLYSMQYAHLNGVKLMLQARFIH